MMQTELEEQEIIREPESILTNGEKIAIYVESLKVEQNLQLCLISGVIAALIGSVAWAVITLMIEMQIGYMAIGIGFLVGYAIQFTGKGIDTIFGISGAILALLSCVLGNLLSVIGFSAKELEIGYFELLSVIDLSIIPSVMVESFSFMDILFYGFAIYQGYNVSFRQITEEEIFKIAPNRIHKTQR